MTHQNEPYTNAAKSAYRPPANNQPTEPASANTRLIRWAEVHQITGLCRSHVHAMAARGEFAKPVKIGNRASAWVESEVLQWVQDRIEASRTSSEKEGAE